MIIYADGAGDGRIAHRIEYDNGKVVEYITQKSVKTHNEAEWESLLWAVTQVNLYHPVTIFMDSELVVKQYNEEYKCKNDRMRKYRDQTQLMVNQRGLHIEVKWVPREKNKAGWLLE